MDLLLDFDSLKVYVEVVSQIVLGLVIAATALARVLNGGQYADEMEGVKGKVLKAIQFLPTIGVNPRTKHLEEQLKEMKASLSEVELPKGNQ